jgi:hypothetical protein
MKPSLLEGAEKVEKAVPSRLKLLVRTKMKDQYDATEVAPLQNTSRIEVAP